jgi:hypothetical protein
MDDKNCSDKDEKQNNEDSHHSSDESSESSSGVSDNTDNTNKEELDEVELTIYHDLDWINYHHKEFELHFFPLVSLINLPITP